MEYTIQLNDDRVNGRVKTWYFEPKHGNHWDQTTKYHFATRLTAKRAGEIVVQILAAFPFAKLTIEGVGK